MTVYQPVHDVVLSDMMRPFVVRELNLNLIIRHGHSTSQSVPRR